jgi:hypothetical protein
MLAAAIMRLNCARLSAGLAASLVDLLVDDLPALLLGVVSQLVELVGVVLFVLGAHSGVEHDAVWRSEWPM